MPRLTVWMVRAALLHLGVGFTVGMLMLFNKGVPLAPAIYRLLPVHIEMLLLGWTIQLGMGVAFWVLPRFPKAPRYGRERLGWTACGLLNAGITLMVANIWLAYPWLPFVGRALELAAVIAFAVLIFPRVKAFNHPPSTAH